MATNPRKITADVVLEAFEGVNDFGQTAIKLLVIIESELAHVLAVKLGTTISQLPKLNFFTLASLALASDRVDDLRTQVLELSKIRNVAAHQLGSDIATDAVAEWMKKHHSYLKWPRQRQRQLSQFHKAVAMMTIRINSEGHTGIFQIVPDCGATLLRYNVIRLRNELSKRHPKAVQALLSKAVEHLQAIQSAVRVVANMLETDARAAQRLTVRAAEIASGTAHKRLLRYANLIAATFERLTKEMILNDIDRDQLRIEWRLRNSFTWRAAQGFLADVQRDFRQLRKFVDEDGYATRPGDELLDEPDKALVLRVRSALAALSLEALTHKSYCR